MPEAPVKEVEKHEGDETLLDQRAANYRPAVDFSKTCAMCAHFRPSHYRDSAACHVVAGSIRPDYTSDLFEQRPPNSEPVSMGRRVEISKVDVEQRIAFGWANVAVDKDGDTVQHWSGENVDLADLEKAAYTFVLHYRAGGEMHAGPPVAELVESFIVTPEKLAKMGLKGDALPGGWWIGLRINDPDAWEGVKSGKYKMFSIQGTATKVPVPEPADG